MTSLIKVPFASSGDKTAVPDTDATGAVNMTQGYGQAYSLDPATDPSAKRIERDKMNWLFNRITQAINEIQVSGVTPFITSADNGGSPFSYGKGAIVSLSGAVYQSLVANNTTTPPGANWSLIPEKIQPLDATLTALAALTGAADKLAYFNGAETAALTALTDVGRDIIGKTTIADVLTYLGLEDIALAGTMTGVFDTNGYMKIPAIINGVRKVLIFQWMSISASATASFYNLPVAWPTKGLHAWPVGQTGIDQATTASVFVETGLSAQQVFVKCINAAGALQARGVSLFMLGL